VLVGEVQDRRESPIGPTAAVSDSLVGLGEIAEFSWKQVSDG
jgi:hypothetical protein